MKQFNKIKSEHPDAILLFRVGDFYETFGEDAVTASSVLGIVLTKRSNGSASETELAGFPHHSLNTYLPKLIKAGFRVAICEQLENPKLTKSIVKRGVTEVVSPGLAIDESILETSSNNYIACIYFGKKVHGLALLDISTGEFLVSEGDLRQLNKLLKSYEPSEVIFSKSQAKRFQQEFGEGYYTYPLDDWIFEIENSRQFLKDRLKVKSLKGFGVDQMENAIIAAGSCIRYLLDSEHSKFDHINKISRIEEDKIVWLDQFSIRNLELIDSPNIGAKTLIDILDKCQNPMGSRMLRKWIVQPLKLKDEIDVRLNMVECFIKNKEQRDSCISTIKEIGDLERMVAKISMGKSNPREIDQLRKSLTSLETLKDLLINSGVKQFSSFGNNILHCNDLIDKISKTIEEEPPVNTNKTDYIKDGISKKLDEYRDILSNGKDRILGIQEREANLTGITSLKVGFNNVFGYYLEVRNTHKNKVPESWIRKQTLSSAERYITPELKEIEEKMLEAEEKSGIVQEDIFQKLIVFAQEYIQTIQFNALIIAELDCYSCFANTALANNYSKPALNNSLEIHIVEGRHPVIEKQLGVGESYIPNDILLNDEEQQIIVITGPNMSGKSAVLRQTALIVLMAQMGCFVPAKSAKIGIVDKIFTRVGATDNISSGESTFMVEMNETASIINNISNRSLILLDEIGRGTSTYDGISIAWSIAEYLHNHPEHKPKTLFATHYHELNELADKYNRIQNFRIDTKEIGKQVIFLRKLVKGGSKHSFGIHVAEMAGMPESLIKRSMELLAQLEEHHIQSGNSEVVKNIAAKDYQLNIFNASDPRFEEIKKDLNSIEINALTPIEAMMKLHEIIRKINS
ncbi:MAG: DNA mismatch repair protein MutS [Chitinophagales bacterium]|nr:DNA mismatch repair protein MutS [Chitinophagales bacterium]